MSLPKKRSPKSDRHDLLAQMLLDYERSVLLDFLRQHRGHLGATAKALGIGHRGLQKKLAVHGLQEEAGRLRAEAGIRGPRQARD